MNKKPYQKPVVKKVSLEMHTAVLSICHSSLVGDSATQPGGCRVAICYEGVFGLPPMQ